MAKKENKKAEKKSKDKKGKKGKNNNTEGLVSTGVPTTGVPTTGVPTAGVPNGVSSTGGIPTTGQPSVPLSAMTPDQMSVAQLEQAIKESNDPQARLKRLRSPINLRSCLLNILALIVITVCIVILWCYLAVDKFNFVTVVKDMSSQFGITQGFQWLGNTIRGWFS